MIQLQHISKVYEGATRVEALKDISLEVKEGEIFGIIGQSGAGKSTLIRCINMLEAPTSGSVIVNGTDLTTLSKSDLRKARKDIGMIFQHFNLLSPNRRHSSGQISYRGLSTLLLSKVRLTISRTAI